MSMRLAWLVTGVVWVLLAARFFHSYSLETPFGHIWGVDDDVYITADFARTFAEGGGLRWYAGAPKVEGFSSPLWTLILALIHRTPGFSERALGLPVFLVNAALLLATAAVFWSGLRGMRVRFDVDAGSARQRLAVAAATAALGTVSLCLWVSEGFEVALVALASLAAFVEATREPGEIRVLRVGLLVGLAFWARMDAALYCSAPVLLTAYATRGTRSFWILAASVGGFVLALFAFRFAYYGEWMPNTYYLKATGWPIGDRLPGGLLQNLPALGVFVLLVLPALAILWESLGGAARYVAAAFLVHGLTLAYSTGLGGDFSFQRFGYDRFTSISSVFLLFGVVSTVLFARLQRSSALRVAVWAALVVVTPVLAHPSWEGVRLANLFDLRHAPLPMDDYGHRWAQYGFTLAELTRPGAKVAVCQAGAPLYFSRRAGADLSGKVDPHIARMAATGTPPPDARCWRKFPAAGHNKEDTRWSFAAHEPDMSMVAPPRAIGREYVEFEYRGVRWFARRASTLVRWERIRGESG